MRRSSAELEALLRGVVDRDPATSGASVQALLSFDIPTLGGLLAGLEPGHTDHHWAITKLLQHLERTRPGNAANQLRTELLASRDESVVRDALGELGEPWDPRSFGMLTRLLAGQPSDAIFAFTLHALARQSDPRAIHVLASHVRDASPFRRAQAAQALGILGDARGREPLLGLVHDRAHAWNEDRGPSFTVADVARDALRQLGGAQATPGARPLDRPLRALAWAQLGIGGIGLAAGTWLCPGLALSGDAQSRAAAVVVPLFLMLATFVLVPACTAGIGLLRRWPWARPLAIVVAFGELLVIPVGTVVGAVSLWILLRNGAPQRGATGAVPGGAGAGIRSAVSRLRLTPRVRGVLLAMLAVASGFVVVIGAGFAISGTPVPREVAQLGVPGVALIVVTVGCWLGKLRKTR